MDGNPAEIGNDYLPNTRPERETNFRTHTKPQSFRWESS